MIIIGIDPGLKGAVCVLGPAKAPRFHPAGAVGLTDAIMHLRLLEATLAGSGLHAVVEAAQAMPGQGVSSMFRYGQGYGEILGTLKAFKIPHTLVHPRTWTKVMLQGVPTRFSGKERAAHAASQLFPSIDLKRTPRCKKPDEGYIDSLLIAEWCRRHLKLS